MTDKVLWDCPLCEVRGIDKEALRIHLMLKGNPFDPSYVRNAYILMIAGQKVTCPVDNCIQTFSFHYEAIDHLRLFHNIQ